MSAAVSQYLRLVMPTITLTMRARLLAEVLGHYADRDGQAWCSVGTLAARTGMHPGAVRRARAELVDVGVIAVDQSLGGAPGSTNTYRFPVASAIHTPRPVARGDDARPRAVQRATPRHTARDPAPHSATKIHEGSIEDAELTFADVDPATIPLHARQTLDRVASLFAGYG